MEEPNKLNRIEITNSIYVESITYNKDTIQNEQTQNRGRKNVEDELELLNEGIKKELSMGFKK